MANVINPLVKKQASNPMAPSWQGSNGLMGSYNKPLPGPGTSQWHQKPDPTSPEGRLASDTAAGYANADAQGIGKEGSMGRLNDERKPAVDELLAKQKAGLDGMTPQEQQAAREQGMAGINQQLGTNMQQFGDVAAANGIRGGSAAGLQMQALGQAQAASGQLSRQMILDNMAQKNIAMDRYGNTLQTQQGVGLGIQDSNNQSSNAEKLARELAAGNYTSQLDSYRSGDKANDFTQQGLDITKDQVDFLKNQGRTPLPVNPSTGSVAAAAGAAGTSAGPGKQGVDTTKLGPGQTAVKNDDGSSTITTINPDSTIHTETVNVPASDKGTVAKNQVKYAVGSGATPSVGPDGKVILTMPDGRKITTDYSESEYASIANEIDAQKASIADANSGTSIADQITKGATGQKIICTEAYRQGLISHEKWLVTGRYRALLSMTEYKGYLTWAAPVVARMKASPEFAEAIAPFIRRMIEGERYALGEIGSLTLGERTVATLVKAANYTGALVRSLRLKVRAREVAAHA